MTFENIVMDKVAVVGEIIRAYGEPIEGLEECFVEGVVVNILNKPVDCFVIKVTKDVFDGAEESGRVGQEVSVPFEVEFLEQSVYIRNLSR